MNDLEHVSRLDHTWNGAYQNKDAEALERVLAEDWVAFIPEGRKLTKPEILEAVPHNPDAQLTFDEFEVTLFGDTAITRGRLTAVGAETRRQRFLPVYAQRQGQWQAVSVQVVPILEIP